MQVKVTPVLSSPKKSRRILYYANVGLMLDKRCKQWPYIKLVLLKPAAQPSKYEAPTQLGPIL